MFTVFLAAWYFIIIFEYLEFHFSKVRLLFISIYFLFKKSQSDDVR